LNKLQNNTHSALNYIIKQKNWLNRGKKDC
jgi:hypothetical protein